MVSHLAAGKRSFPISVQTVGLPDPDKLVSVVTTSLEDDKAEDVMVIDLRGRSSLADHLVIASGRSQRQLGAMADHLAEKFKASGLVVSLEGVTQGDWVLIDAGDVVVHLFRPEVRSFYDLERIWGVPSPTRSVEMPPSAG